MGWISWIVVGAIAGFLATIITGARTGLLWMVVLGVLGGLIGGWVSVTFLKMGSVNGINVESIVIATIGAAAVILAARFANGSRGLSGR